MYLDDSIKSEDIRKTFGMGKSRFRSWSKSVIKETGLKRVPNTQRDSNIMLVHTEGVGHRKHYYKHGNKYKVMKMINGRIKHFGVYDSEEEAKEVVNELVNNNWNTTNI